MDKPEITKLIEATQDGRNLEDAHPISALISWAIENNQPEVDFNISEVFANLEYAIEQLENAKEMIKLVRHVRGQRY